jgi:hypothetical protein
MRWSTPVTSLKLSKPISEFSFVTALWWLPYTINFWVPTRRSINYIVKVLCSDCDTFAICNTLYRYKFIWSQLSTNRFVSPRASESALSYTHWVHNNLTIMANNWSLNHPMYYWSQIYRNIQPSCFAIYWMENILRHSGHMNPNSYLPRPRRCGWNWGWLIHIHSLDRTPIYQLLVSNVSHIWLCICGDALMLWYWWHLISLGMNHCSTGR